MKQNRIFIVFFTLAVLIALPRAALACTFPNGTEGELVYNSTFKVMQYCDGDDWIAMSTSSSGGAFLWQANGNRIFYSTDNVGINVTNPTERLHVVGNSIITGTLTAGNFSGNGAAITNINGDNIQNGSIDSSEIDDASLRIEYLYDSGGTWRIRAISAGMEVRNQVQYGSDRRLKDNIMPLGNALQNISAINGVSFDWKPEAGRGDKKQLGIIAQEVESVYPELVEDNGDYKTVHYDGLIAPLIEAVKELKAINEEQEQRIKALEAKLE